MLGKLIKYDFKSTSRVLWLMYIALIIVAGLFGFSIRLNSFFYGPEITEDYFVYDYGYESGSSSSFGVENIFQIINVAFFLICILLVQAVFILTMVTIVQRFYKNMLGGEGYLMHTLPVKTVNLIWSKMIVAMIWMALACVAGLIAGFLFSLTSGFLVELIRQYGWADLLEFFGHIFSLNGILTIIYLILAAFAGIARCYVSMAIGNLANKNKFLFAVLAYVAIGIVVSIMTAIVGVNAWNLLNDIWLNWINEDQIFTGVLISGIIGSLVMGTIYFLVTNYLLKNKLNLA